MLCQGNEKIGNIAAMDVILRNDPEQDLWFKITRIMIHFKGTAKFYLEKDKSACLMHHDPIDGGS